MDVFAATLRTLDLAFFVFRKAQDDFERLLAIFAVELVAGHDDLRKTPGDESLTNHVRPGNGGVNDGELYVTDGLHVVFAAQDG